MEWVQRRDQDNWGADYMAYKESLKCQGFLEWVSLEGTTGGYLMQPPCSGRVPSLYNITQDWIQMIFDYLHSWGLYNLSEISVVVLVLHKSLKVENISWYSERTSVFQFKPSAPCLIIAHHWQEPGSFLALFFYVLMHNGKIFLTLLFFRPNTPRSLSLSSCRRCSSPLIIFVVLFGTLSSSSVSLLYWGDWDRTQYSRCASPSLGRKKDPLPQSADNTLLNAVQTLAFHAARAHWLLLFTFVSTRNSMLFSVHLLFQMRAL